MASDRHTHIGLLIHGASDYRRDVRRGISAFARTRPWLSIETWDGKTPPVEWVRRFRGDGVIAQVTRRPLCSYLRRQRRLPVVNISGWIRDPGLPTVQPDDRAIGRVAAEYFLERGYRQCAYLGIPEAAFSLHRGDAYQSAIEQAGGHLRRFIMDVGAMERPPRGWDPELQREWVRSLPTPTGLFVVGDDIARNVLRFCQDLSIRVPEKMAILGVNDDELICEMTQPALSSVNLRLHNLGFEAVSQLLANLEGRGSTPGKVLLAPGRVTERGSSKALAVDDPVVAHALRFILDHADRVITVESVLDEVGISRRSLEMKFTKALGRTPWEVIRKAHIERAEQFLISSDYSIGRIAELSGFKDAYQFSVMFKKAHGASPSRYRQRHRF
jgi:LacI family transcriptional regulator